MHQRIYDIYRFCLANGLEGVDFDADFGRYPLRPENYVTCRMIAEPEGRFEDFLRLMAGREDIAYVTNREALGV